MKRAITILLAAALMLSMAACGGGSGTPTAQDEETPEKTAENSVWEINAQVDDFGDATDEKTIRGLFSGSFSNTATSDSDLNIYVFCSLYPNGSGQIVFRLLEYGNTKATFTNSEAENIILKTKVDDVVEEYKLVGVAPNSDLIFHPMDKLTDETVLLNYLYEGKEISCVINIGNSKYTFKINGAGFAKLYDELTETPETPTDIMTSTKTNTELEQLRKGLNNGTILSAGSSHTVGLKADSTVVAVGDNKEGQCNVADWQNIIAVAAGGSHTAGVKADGTVVAVGSNTYGQCDVSEWKNISAIAAGSRHTIGLKTDGTVIAAGQNLSGQCDVSDWHDIVAISAKGHCTIGLKADGTVIATNPANTPFDKGQNNVSDWHDMIAIDSNGSHTVGLKADGTVVAVGDNKEGQCNVSDWQNIVAISAGDEHTVGLKADGTVVAVGKNLSGVIDISGWRDIIAISTGKYQTVGLKADGTVVATEHIGNELFDYGQSHVSEWNLLQ